MFVGAWGDIRFLIFRGSSCVHYFYFAIYAFVKIWSCDHLTRVKKQDNYALVVRFDWNRDCIYNVPSVLFYKYINSDVCIILIYVSNTNYFKPITKNMLIYCHKSESVVDFNFLFNINNILKLVFYLHFTAIQINLLVSTNVS